MVKGTWEKATNTPDVYPSRGVFAGVDKDGSKTFIARAPFTTPNNIIEIIPGKIVIKQNQPHFYFCYGEKEHGYKVDTNSVEFLVNDGYDWEFESRAHGELPENAVIGGKGVRNMAHHIGRTCHDGAWIPGKIDGANKCLYIPHGGKEFKYNEYHVLVRPETAISNENTSSGFFVWLRSIGRIFTDCKVDITNNILSPSIVCSV